MQDPKLHQQRILSCASKLGLDSLFSGAIADEVMVLLLLIPIHLVDAAFLLIPLGTMIVNRFGSIFRKD